MANAVYPKFKAACMSGGANTNLLAGNVKALQVDTTGGGGYTYSATHEFVSDIPGGAIVARSGNLASKSVTAGGAFQSGNALWSAVTGIQVDAIILYVDSGADSTSRLVGYFDTGVTGLPVTPAGASYNGIPDSSGWFSL